MKPDKLMIGKVYFSCGCVHPKYPVPTIKAYVYIGTRKHEDIKGKDEKEYVFQDPTKYYEDDILQALTPSERKEYQGVDEPTDLIVIAEALHTIIDFEGLTKFISKLKSDPNAEYIY